MLAAAHVGVHPVDGICFRIIVGDHDRTVGAFSVLVVRRHLEIVPALHFPHERQRQFHVLFLAEALVIAELSGDIEGVAFAGRNILPEDAVIIRFALGGRKIVRDDQLHIRVFRHPVFVTALAEEVDREILADVDITFVVRPLCFAARLIEELFTSGDDIVDKGVPRGGFGRFLRVGLFGFPGVLIQ